MGGSSVCRPGDRGSRSNGPSVATLARFPEGEAAVACFCHRLGVVKKGIARRIKTCSGAIESCLEAGDRGNRMLVLRETSPVLLSSDRLQNSVTNGLRNFFLRTPLTVDRGDGRPGPGGPSERGAGTRRQRSATPRSKRTALVRLPSSSKLSSQPCCIPSTNWAWARTWPDA